MFIEIPSEKTMRWILIIFVMFVLYVLYSHAPLYKIDINKKKKIALNGMIHFTNLEVAHKIVKEGLIGKKSTMAFEPLLGELVWNYPYTAENIDKKHELLLKNIRGLSNPKRYSVCIKISGISKEDLDKLYTRHGAKNDDAIVYKGKLLVTKNIEIIKVW